ncbi:sulfite exporter TauE/SafE family protein [Gordonia phthalatica]|uniref:Probable membrane transporter protein n=1 Tax=Gordonia phthalatica TaxID=1136941 RepID=A0A0N9MZ33_9ACTN|nr:sulfite exporter TauE/SafE family protein [Gordonia phthalatica]ALG83304.1 hypothetical protein ACH46_00750 [Gordonia phthalatica]
MSALVAGIGCVWFAAIVGGATGFGSALIGTPLMLLVGVDLPVAVAMNLAAGFVTRAAVAVQLRSAMVRKRVIQLCLGAVPGIFAGLALLSWLPMSGLRVFAGAATVVCGIWLALPTARAGRPGSVLTVATGVVGGFLTSTTSLGGPPPVLLMQWARVPSLTFIADLAGYFVVTTGLSLVVLVAGGKVPTDLPWWLIVGVLAAAMAGNAIGMRIARRLGQDRFRVLVIVFVVVAGIATLLT